LGSTTGLTDSNGVVTESASYDSFGRTISSNLTTRYQYTGREYDEYTGLMFYRARFYDPQIGRFISEDPIGFAGGINLFDYVKSNPVLYRDPTGLRRCHPLVGAIVGGIIGATIGAVGGAVVGPVVGGVIGGAIGGSVGGTVGLAGGPVGSVTLGGAGSVGGAATGAAVGVIVGPIIGGVGGGILGSYIGERICSGGEDTFDKPCDKPYKPDNVIPFPGPRPTPAPMLPPPPPPSGRGPRCLSATISCFIWANGDDEKQERCMKAHNECVSNNLPVIYPNGVWVD